MKNDHSISLMRVVSPAHADAAPGEKFVRNVATGPPDIRPNLAKKANPDLKLTSGRHWRLTLLVALFAIAGPALVASQSDPLNGSKLVGNDVVAPAEEGWSVALSADGNTAIVGGAADNKLAGAAWIYVRSGNGWVQQGSKLVGNGTIGTAGQGITVALSADGNTAIVGGPYDDKSTGAAWIYVRNGDAWSQQGSKLVGTGAVGSARQGASVALSGNGNTAIVGASGDHSYTGAIWVYVRSGGSWTQQGNKLVGTGAAGHAGQGAAVALSDDGNTALVGGPADNAGTGAAWVYIRQGSSWTQQGNKLAGVGAVGKAQQGDSVALSANGDIAIVGGPGDDSFAGAAWIYNRNGGVWTQQGKKLVGTGSVGKAAQGHSVALSGDGRTAMVGGPQDNSYTGAAWVHTRTGTAWSQQGDKLVGNGATGPARQGSSVGLSADGNTGIAGGLSDDRLTGAAWIHNRTEGVWNRTPAEFLGY